MRRHMTTAYAAMVLGARGHAAGMPGMRMRNGPPPEKYPGQRDAYRAGAWPGDGVKPAETRQMRRHPRG